MRKLVINGLISLAIGGLFVWLAIRDVDWDRTLDVLAKVDLGVVGLYLGLFIVVHFSRVLRWKAMLTPLGHVPFGRLFTVASVGFMALILLPLRLGEVVRPVLIAERGKIRISAALATIVVERVVDALFMAILLVAILFFLGDEVGGGGLAADLGRVADLRFWAWVILVGFLCLLAFLMLAYWRQELAVDWFTRLLKPLSARLAHRLASILHSFIGGLKALPDLRLFGAFLALTLIYWGLNAVGLWLVFGTFEGLEGLGFIEACTVLSVLCVGLMIPAGPGMIGNFHYFIKLGLSLYVSEAVLGSGGVAYAILIHAIQLAQQVVFGVACLFSGHISFRRLIRAPAGVEAGLEGGSGGGQTA
ncbi:MAG: flippase-like domain-containing protein [Deltaproteobacteria bacterium]|nr:flippase-like domain-containing protein [Deltaproteobacteria bacterium]